LKTDRFFPFAWGFYLVGFMLVAGAVTEPVVQILPMRPGDVMWRFGAAGLLSGAVIGFVFGVAWLMGVALLLEHRRALRALSALGLATALVLLIAAGLFALDFVQVRGSVNPAIRRNVDLTVLRALVIIAAAIPTTAALGLAGWRATRMPRRLGSDDRAPGMEPKPLLYRRKR
jgi:hypothetical protein